MNERILTFLSACSAFAILGCESKSEHLKCMDKVTEAYEACRTSGGDALTCLNRRLEGSRYCSDNYGVSTSHAVDRETERPAHAPQQDAQGAKYLDNLQSFTFRPGRSISSKALPTESETANQAILVPFGKRVEADSEKFWTDEELAIASRNSTAVKSQILQSHIIWTARAAKDEIIEYDSESGQAIVTSPLSPHTRFREYSDCFLPHKTGFLEIEFDQLRRESLYRTNVVKIKIGQMSDSIGINVKERRSGAMVATVPMPRELGRAIIEDPNVYLQWHLAFKMDGAEKYHYDTCVHHNPFVTGATYYSNHIISATLAYATLVAVQNSLDQPRYSRKILASWSSGSYRQKFLRDDLVEYLFLFGYLETMDGTISDEELAIAISTYEAKENISFGGRVIDPSVVALLIEDQNVKRVDSAEVREATNRFYESQVGPIEAALPLEVNHGRIR